MKSEAKSPVSRKVAKPFKGKVQTPTLLQMEAVECGAASLGIILGYHRRFVPLEELRVACGVSRDGSKASNVLKAARTFGLQATGYKKDIDGLQVLKPPYIVFWNFNHFVVVDGFGKDKVYLNDPAVGPRVVTATEFDMAYTGVVLVFERSPEFQPGGQPKRPFRGLPKRLRNTRLALIYAVIATLALAIPNLVIPVFLRVYVDDFLVAGKQNWLVPLLLLMSVVVMVKALLTLLQQWMLLKIETKLAVASSAEFLWHVLLLPMEFFSQRYAGEVSGRVQLNDQVAALLAGNLATGAANVLFVGLYALLMFHYDATLTWIGITAGLVNVVVLQQMSRRRKDQNVRLLQERGKLTGVSMAALQLIETIKSTGAESDYFSRWAGYQAKVINAEQELGVSSQVLSTIPVLVTGVTGVAVLVVGSLRVMNGFLTLGALIAVQALMSSFLEPINRLVDLGGTLQEAEGDLGRLEDVAQYPLPHVKSIEVGRSEPLTGKLELRNVTFGYSRLDPPQLKNFSLTLLPGQRVALVGGSGSGKSTVAKLVSGLYEPWEGEILFDGQSRRDIPPDVMSASLAMVDQDISMFGGTIRDNLTLWDDAMPEATVMQAAEDAVIHGDITSRTGGYNSMMEEEGRNFSGGQRQRMEIARALTANPRLLVLDEATSALDTLVERMIDDRLRRRGCTCLIVAHRLSTVRDCDEIVVLSAGSIQQRGTHEALIDMGGLYADLVRAG